MALSKTTVKVSEVKTALGTTKNSVLDLCKNNLESGKSINKWSAHKPLRSSDDSYTLDNLESDQVDADYSLDVDSNFASAKNALTTAGGNTELWQYQAPLGTSLSKCRIGDFRGYEHQAPVPYYSEVEVEDGLDGYYGPKFYFYVKTNSGAEISAANMPTLNRNNSGKWFILWRRVQTTPVNPEEEEIGSISSTSFPFHKYVNDIPATVSSGYYEACAAVYKSSRGQYCPVPNTYKKFYLTVETDIARFLKIEVTVECYCEEVGNDKWDVYKRIKVKNVGNSSISSAYQFILRWTDHSSPEDATYTGSTGSNIAVGSSVYFYPGTQVTWNGGQWGKSGTYEGLSNPGFNYSGWVNKNGSGYHAEFSGNATII